MRGGEAPSVSGEGPGPRVWDAAQVAVFALGPMALLRFLVQARGPWLAPRTRYGTALRSFLHPEVPWCNAKPGGDAGAGSGRSVAVGLWFPCTTQRWTPGTVTHHCAGLGPEKWPLGAV